MTLPMRWAVPIGFKLTDPPPQSPFYDFDLRPDPGLGIRVLSFKLNSLVEIFGIEKGRAAFDIVAVFAQESARRQ